MRICSLRNKTLLSRCVFSDILNRKFPPKKPFRLARNAWRFRCHVLSLIVKLKGFWVTDSNRKQDLFPFYMPWRHHICIDKCPYSYKDDLPENLPKNNCPTMQKVHFHWPLKHLILTRNVSRYSNETIKYIVDSALQSKRSMLTILFSLDFRFLNSCGSLKRRKTDMIYQEQHASAMKFPGQN